MSLQRAFDGFSAAGRTALCAACGVLLACAVSNASADTGKIEAELSGRLAMEGRWFPNEAAHPGQRDGSLGFTAEPTLYLEHEDGGSFTLTPHYRYDGADPHRTNADLREAYLLVFDELGEGEWEARLGVDRVFWGVTEFHHLVNIVNQVDLTDHPNEESRMGQLMAHLTWSTDWGELEFFAMPLHRERTLPGRKGRLRTQVPFDQRRVSYESAAEEWHVDLAARYSRSIGPLDMGVSVFDGTSREPSFIPTLQAVQGLPFPVPRTLVPHYAQIRQYGLDAQLTIESWLIKLEAIRREGARNRADMRNPAGKEEDYAAFAAGVEYTFSGVFDSEADISLLGEWSYDERGRRSTNRYQNDVFFASRLALNDVENTEFVASVIADTDYSTYIMGFEAKRDLSDSWTATVEGAVMLEVDEKDVIHNTRRDGYVVLNVTYSF
ncbi:MAG: hypothetical protein OXC14_00915 [Rhodospirillaceae bacterium]|nr:hypothetical protein [Rhodospirillaceae bacterium]